MSLTSGKVLPLRLPSLTLALRPALVQLPTKLATKIKQKAASPWTGGSKSASGARSAAVLLIFPVLVAIAKTTLADGWSKMPSEGSQPSAELSVGHASATVELPGALRPRKAIIVAPEAFVRAGPGGSYYPTQILPAGAVVEAYYEDPGGWVAIRPPEGSFSWVKVEDVEIGEDGLAEVIREGAPCFVGSLLSSARDFAPVRLRRGELLRVLEWEGNTVGPIAPLPDGDSPNLRDDLSGWCRVAPPAGEFRWIEARAVRFLIADEQVSAAVWTGGDTSRESVGGMTPGAMAPDNQLGWQRMTSLGDATLSSPGRGDGGRTSAPVGPGAAGQRGLPRGAGQDSDADTTLLGLSPRTKSGAAGEEAFPRASPQREWVARAQPLAGGQDSTSPQRTGKPSGSLQERLDELSLRFAQILLLSPEAWDFSELRRDLQRLIEQASPGSLQEEARSLAARIARAEEIRQRFVQTSGPTPSALISSMPNSPPQTEPSERPLRLLGDAPGQAGTGMTAGQGAGETAPATFAFATVQTVGRSTPGDDRFDAVGRLMRVVPSSWGTPRYALVDESGTIRAFVTPLPGVNLEYYLGTRIGITGTCSVYGSDQVPHVLARSVVPLQSPMSR